MLEREVLLRSLFLVCSESLVWKLKRCINGLNEAPHSWYKWIHCWGTKCSSLLFWELWAELPRIMWPLVETFQEASFILFGSRHQSERTLSFSLLFKQHMHANYPMRTFSLHQQKFKFLTAVMSTTCSVEQLLHLFMVWDLLLSFVIVGNICA